MSNREKTVKLLAKAALYMATHDIIVVDDPTAEFVSGHDINSPENTYVYTMLMFYSDELAHMVNELRDEASNLAGTAVYIGFGVERE